MKVACSASFGNDDLGHILGVTPAPRAVVQAEPYDRARARILMVDDEPINIALVEAYLDEAGFTRVTSFNCPAAALAAIEQQMFDVVLLDLMMPGMSGLDLLARIAEQPGYQNVPVLVLTASTERSLKSRALESGAADFLNKPFDPEELVARLENAIIRKAHFDHLQRYASDLAEQVERRTAELMHTQLQIIHCLARASEFRDDQMGRHVLRVGRYAGVIAEHLGLDPSTVRLIQLAAPLHDVGKIGIPDAILLKSGRLDSDEMETMRLHAELGQQIIQPSGEGATWEPAGHTLAGERLLGSFDSPLLAMAARIAATHHEKWDGSGYPRGLCGEEIPLEGRITAVADVYDALSTKRHYKESFSFESCLEIMQTSRGTHFDPQVLDAFLAQIDEIRGIQREFANIGSGS